MKKPLYKRWSFWLIVLLVVGILGNLLPNKDDSSVSEPPKSEAKTDIPAETKSEAKSETTPQPAEDKPDTIESVIAEVVGEENYVSKHTDIDNTLAMTIEMADNWTANMAVLSAYDQLLEISEQLRSKSLVDENTALHYIFQTDIKDSYGNVEKGNVIIVNLSAETLAEINFDNINSESIPDIADIHFVHPSLQ